MPASFLWLSAIILGCLTLKTGSLPSPLQNFHDNSAVILDASAENGIPEIKDFNCYDLYDNPYISDLPHPYRCDVFIKCSPRLGHDGQLVSVGEQMNCPDFGGGRVLHFSIETCNCEYPEDAVCFNENNSTHIEQKFKCACPLIQDDHGNLVLDDDKCSHR